MYRLLLEGVCYTPDVGSSPLRRILRGLFKRPAPGEPLLREIRLSLAPGESAAVFGTGRRALCRIAAGALSPGYGRRRAARRVAAALDGHGLLPGFSAARNARLLFRLSGLHWRADVLTQLCGLCGLTQEDCRDTPVEALPAAARAAVGVALALLRAPELLILTDASHCTPAFWASAIPLIRRLRQGGMALLYGGDDEALAARLCERGIWLAGGRIVRDGPLMADAALPPNVLPYAPRAGGKAALERLRAAVSAPLSPGCRDCAALNEARQEARRLNEQTTSLARANDAFAQQEQALLASLSQAQQRARELEALLARLLKAFAAQTRLLREQFLYLHARTLPPPAPPAPRKRRFRR